MLLGLAVLVVAGAATPVLLRAAGKQPKKTDGSYQVTVAGYYSGKGTVDVKNKKLSLVVDIVHEDLTAILSAANLHLDGDHFEGTTTLPGGTKVFIRGRLDGYESDKDFRGARLLCTYVDEAGHHGRIVGVLK